ncbi:UDP-N-acetylmuramoyl-L-alanyl-D-glutamate--2,6-diaminopimelate ligase [Thiovibrio sp. JS02]
MAKRVASLRELLEGVAVLNADALEDRQITGIASDSRQVVAGGLFVAVPGLTVDGHDYLDAAVEQGCVAVLVEKGRGKRFRNQKILCLEVVDTRTALGRIAAAFYGWPAARLVMIGITGTNGKTTTTYLLESVLRQAGGNPGVIGTVNYRYNQVVLPAPFTTPDPVVLQRILADMVTAGVSHVVMEVSSHALEQKRLASIFFDVALFTNLTRDHLDFHGSMEQYYASKKSLFLSHLKPEGAAVILCGSEPAADDWGRRLLAEVRESAETKKAASRGLRIIDCGLGQGRVRVLAAQQDLAGTTARLQVPAGEVALRSVMVGRFNLKNLLGAFGVGMALGIAVEKIAAGLEAAPAAPGRLERAPGPGGVAVFVDYAHTPDALENVLQTLREVSAGRLIVVFGCGGDRDRGKRPLMGSVAARYADIVVLTSDNPRSEEPALILAEIERGLAETGLPRMRAEALLGEKGLKGYDVIVSRREAIRTTLSHARPGDVVAVCGKGHETYQITRKGKIFFDDRVEAAIQSAVVNW